MKRLGLPAGAAFAAASALVAGCAPSGEKAAQSTQPAVANPIVTAGPKIRACNNGDPQPPIAFLVKLTGALDVRKVQADIKEMDANVNFPNGDPSTKRAPPPPSNPTTRLDLNLDLKQTGNTRNRARIIVQLDDPTITFHGDDLAINSLDSNGNGQNFLCFRSYTAKEAIVDAKYYNGNGNKPNYGTMNINLIVPETGTTYIMPISLDPEVKNNG